MIILFIMFFLGFLAGLFAMLGVLFMIKDDPHDVIAICWFVLMGICILPLAFFHQLQEAFK